MKKSKLIRPIATYLLSIWSIMIGTRFIIGYFLGDIYPLGISKETIEKMVKHSIVEQPQGFSSVEFDMMFDWGILLILGIIVLSYHIIDFYIWIKKREKSG